MEDSPEESPTESRQQEFSPGRNPGSAGEDLPFGELLDAAAECILIVDGDGRITWLNRRAEELFNYQRNELWGRSVEVLVPEELREVHRRHREKYLTEPRNRPMGVNLDLVARRRDGSRFPAEISLSHAGTPDNFLVMVVVRDISSRRAREAAFYESEAKYRSLINDVLDSSPVGILVLDSDLQVVWVNRALEQFFGLRRDEVAGQEVKNLLLDKIGKSLDRGNDFVQKVMFSYAGNSPGEPLECHVQAGKERQERWLEYRSQVIPSGLYAGGRIEHFHDIGALKASEEEKVKLIQDQVDRLEEELGILERLAGRSRSSVTARSLGILPLREYAPNIFLDLVGEYRKAMDRALEAKMYKIADNTSEMLRDLSGRLGFLKADPRDLVDIHSTALKQKSRESSAMKVRDYVAEGHLVLVELMGYLASYYRNLAHGSRQDNVR